MAKYRDFDITIPRWLAGEEWEDTSFRNDVTANSELVKPLAESKGREIRLRVWVHPSDQRQREYPNCPRFCVEVYVTSDYGTDEIAHYDANTPREAQQRIKYVQQQEWALHPKLTA